MTDSSFGLKIGLESEREFKRAITEIKSKLAARRIHSPRGKEV